MSLTGEFSIIEYRYQFVYKAKTTTRLHAIISNTINNVSFSLYTLWYIHHCLKETRNGGNSNL